MRAIDSSNPEIFRPSRFAGIAAILPILLVLFCLPLASGVAPDIPFLRNPIILVLCAILAVFVAMMWVPFVFQWDWQAKYFGALLLYVGAVALIGFVPCICLALYGTASTVVRVTPLLVYIVAHFLWCRRFVAIYDQISKDSVLYECLYEEEEDAIYYMQRADKELLDKKLKFKQVPDDRYFIIFVSMAFALVLMRSMIKDTLGVPFIHVFLLVSVLPVSLTCLGFAVRAWLIFYFYPMRIRTMTGKRVYVDMSGKTRVPR